MPCRNALVYQKNIITLHCVQAFLLYQQDTTGENLNLSRFNSTEGGHGDEGEIKSDLFCLYDIKT